MTRLPILLCAALMGTMLPLVPSLALGSSRVQQELGTTDVTFTARNFCRDFGGFPVTIHITGEWRDILRFDADGNLTNLIETDQHVRLGYSANGKTLTAIGAGGFAVSFYADGTQSVSTFGIDQLLTIPGHGTIMLQAGHAELFYDDSEHVVMIAGPSYQDRGAMCAALA